MPFRFLLLLGAATLASAEVHTLTLGQVADVAMRQAPEAIEARLDQQKAAERVRIAHDPFVPKVFAGSGLAYSSGFPMSIEGASPSVVQANAVASVYNREQKFQLAQAHEELRGATLDAQVRRQQVVLRSVQLFLDAEQKGRMADVARRQVESAERVAPTIQARIQEGRALPIEAKRADLGIARARQSVQILENDRDYAEGSLAMVLGYTAGDRVRPAVEDRPSPELPMSADEAVEQALQDNVELRKLESAVLAKNLQLKANQSARYPKLDLVAQYGLFARFNHYEDYFRTFQRNNGQIGVSIQVPILFGPRSSAAAAIATAEAEHLRVEANATRSRITLEAQRRFQELQQAQSARQVARLDLDVTRDALTVLLAQMEEGRATLQQVEQARQDESAKWLAYYEAQHNLDAAAYALLDRTGRLLAALR